MPEIVIPLGLAFLMATVGLETRIADFRALATAPRAALAGLLAQWLMLPAVAFGLASVLPLSPATAVGLVLLAAVPGGVTANWVTLMARGDVALAVTLTVATSLAAPFVVPVWVSLAFAAFAGESVAVNLPFLPAFAAIAATTVLPLALALAVGHLRPDLVAPLRPGLRRASGLVFATIVATAIFAQWKGLAAGVASAGPASVLFSLVTVGVVIGAGHGLGLDPARRAALVQTTGLRNVALALTVAVTLLGRPEMALPATVHVVTMNAVAMILVRLARRGGRLVGSQGGDGPDAVS